MGKANSAKDRAAVLRSMTGFGHAAGTVGPVSLAVEVRSVNHRFLDLQVRLPRAYSTFDPDIRVIAMRHLSRGRVDVALSRTVPNDGSATKLPAADRFSKLFNEAAQLLIGVGVASKPGSLDPAASVPLALEMLRRSESGEGESEQDIASEKSVVLSCVEAAFAALDSARLTEGAALAAELTLILRQLKGTATELDARISASVAQLPIRLKERVARLAPDIQLDASKLATEVALIAERIDVSEELNRFRTHIDHLELSLTDQPSGKRFDFLLQEAGRELTTLSNKCQDAGIQHLAVNAKLDLEKLREQVQNVE